MEEYDSICVKSEKAGAILLLLNNNLKCVAKLIRIVEIGFVVVVLSWSFSRLPFAVKISGDYCRQLISVMVSPLFTFFVCHVIVLTLLLKAGHILVSQSPAPAGEIESDVYEGFVKTSDDFTDFTNEVPPPLVTDPVVVEYQDKEMIFEESITTVSTGYFNSPVDYEAPLKISHDEVSEVPEFKPENNTSELKEFKRSLSENLKTEINMQEEVEDDYNNYKEEESHPKLRRSETEKWRKISNPGEIPEETVYVFDELSNEEFQRTIEAFIEKQIQFHQEEKLAIVLSSSSHV